MISESLESQNNIEAFANDVLKEIARLTLIYEVKIWEGKKVINFLSSINTTALSRKKYTKKFQNFIQESNLQIIFKKGLAGLFGGESKGKYHSPSIIFLNLKNDFLQKLSSDLNEYDNMGKSEVYVKLYYEFIKTLIHEIQHAYDDWVSKKNYMNNSKVKHFTNSVESYNDNNDEDEDKFKQYNSVFNKYAKLPHEINARFSEAFADIRKYRLDKNDKSDTVMLKKSFEEFKSELFIYFRYWNELGEAVQKRLIKRLYLMWDQLPEKKKTK